MKNGQRLHKIERGTGEAQSCPFCSRLTERELTLTEPSEVIEVIEARCDTCGEPFQIRIVYDEGSSRGRAATRDYCPSSLAMFGSCAAYDL